MANVTVTFTHPEGVETFSYSVDDAAVPIMKAALAAHPVHGYVEETTTVQVQEGTDANGDPIMVDRQVTTRNPATFQQSLESWSKMNVKEAIIGATNAYALAVAEAQAVAAAKAQFVPVAAV